MTYEKPTDATVAAVKAFFERRSIDAQMCNDFLEGYAEDGGISYPPLRELKDKHTYKHYAGLEREKPLKIGTLRQYPLRCHEAYATKASDDDVRAEAVPFVFPQRTSINPCTKINDNEFVPDVDVPARVAEQLDQRWPDGWDTIAEAGIHLYTHRHIVVIDPAFKGTFAEPLVGAARKKLEDEKDDLSDKVKEAAEAFAEGLGARLDRSQWARGRHREGDGRGADPARPRRPGRDGGAATAALRPFGAPGQPRAARTCCRASDQAGRKTEPVERLALDDLKQEATTSRPCAVRTA